MALWALHLFRDQLPARRWLAVQTWAAFAALAAGFAGAGQLTTLAGPISPPTRLSMPRRRPISASSSPAGATTCACSSTTTCSSRRMTNTAITRRWFIPDWRRCRAKRVLVLGGGDGLALREILKYPNVEAVTLVDLDPAMTDLFATRPATGGAECGSLKSPRVTVVNADALQWLEEATAFDFIVIADFPTRPISRSAKALPRPSTGCWKSAWRRGLIVVSRRRRFTPGSRSGA